MKLPTTIPRIGTYGGKEEMHTFIPPIVRNPSAPLSITVAPESKEIVLEKRIFVVEDHSSVRHGIVETLNREPDFIVCGEAEDAAPALSAIAATRPDLVLTDIQLKSSDGIELIRQLRRLYPALVVVGMTIFDPTRYERLAHAAGANAFVVKQEGAKQLIDAVRSALAQ